MKSLLTLFVVLLFALGLPTAVYADSHGDDNKTMETDKAKGEAGKMEEKKDDKKKKKQGEPDCA